MRTGSSNAIRAAIALGIANLVLLGIVGWQAQRLRQAADLPSPTPATLTTHEPSTRTGSPVLPDVPPPAEEMITEKEPAPVFDWRRIESDDYRAYVENLRGIGVPEQTVRDIVAADVRQAFSDQRRELLARHLSTNFWETPDGGALLELSRRKREISQSMGDMLRDLLGGDFVAVTGDAEWRSAEMDLKLGFLPQDKRDQVRETLVLHAELEAHIKAMSDGRPPTTDPEERLRLLTDYEDRRAALRHILTEEEFEDTELQVSWTADNLRRAMVRFEPTADEFRAIFRVWRAHDENLAVLNGLSEPDPGNAHVFEEIRGFLGEERFRKYRETWWK